MGPGPVCLRTLTSTSRAVEENHQELYTLEEQSHSNLKIEPWQLEMEGLGDFSPPDMK